jgi:nitrite reductase/ring-hydroxylating ferredoxin subunit
MVTRSYKRNLFQRILGIPQTRVPADRDCWRLEEGSVRLDLERAPELAEEFGAIRIEAKGLPHPVLVMRDGEGGYRAFRNECSHGRRRLDPVPGTRTVCCCSMGRSTFDYDGKVLSGTAKEPVHPLPVEVMDKRLLIRIV